MAEGGAGSCPQVFVVDSHPNYISVPIKKKVGWERVGQKFLHVLVALTVLGLVVQGVFIYNLYKKSEAFSQYRSDAHHQNLSSPEAAGQRGGTIMSRKGSKDASEPPTPQPQQNQKRPFAHLMGANRPMAENNVMQWMHDAGNAVTHHMSYDKGQLLVEEEGYYYLYSKVQVNAAEECLLIQHKVMRDTSAYDQSIELMKSKSFRCRTPEPPSTRASGVEDLWNSFLAGIFHLKRGDKIFVTLENAPMMPSGPAYNFMGAFMISS